MLERVLPVVDERLAALSEGAHAAALALERVEKRAVSPDHRVSDFLVFLTIEP